MEEDTAPQGAKIIQLRPPLRKWITLVGKGNRRDREEISLDPYRSIAAR